MNEPPGENLPPKAPDWAGADGAERAPEPADDPGTEPAKPDRAGKIVTATVVVALIALGTVLPRFVDLPDITLPDLDWPELPRWLKFLLGPGKLIVLGVLAVLGGIGEAERRRRNGSTKEDT